MSFSEEEIEEFKIEATELLDVAEDNLLNMTPESDFKEVYENIFRSFHNLKGAAGMMELDRLQAHTHEVETIFTEFKGASSMNSEEVDFFLRAIDAARTILEGEEVDFKYELKKSAPPAAEKVETPVVEEQQEESPQPVAENAVSEEENSAESPQENDEDEDFDDEQEASSDDGFMMEIEEFLSEFNEIVDRISSDLMRIEKDGASADCVNDLYREVHSLKGGAYLFGFSEIGNVTHILESLLDRIRRNSAEVPSEVLDVMYEYLKAIEIQVKAIRSTGKEDASDIKTRAVKMKLSTLENLKIVEKKDPNQEEIAISLAPREERVESESEEVATPSLEAVPAVEAAADADPKAGEAKNEKKGADSGASSVRVSVQLLDKLMALMGEMVLVRNQVIQYTNDSDDLDFHNLSKRLNVVTSEIQEQMMKTRMQPIGNVVNKFQRVVRDLAKNLNKEINLKIEGAETELDKSLLEAVKDPLTHIIRNSCDHGLETKEERIKTGKKAAGNVLIKAFHEGGQVVIQVKDDGRGLNKDALIAKAIERGLYSSTQLAEMTDKEIYNLVFAPGFSTAKKVTNVSGRGVGMDVVATNIESIGGTVEIESTPGQGASFLLKIPLTLAIVPALVVNCGQNTLAIPQVKLFELVRVDHTSNQQIEMIQGTPVFRLRGNILPLIDLRNVLDSSGESCRDFGKDGIINIAVVQSEDQYFGLIVDKVRDTADIVVKPLNKLLKSLQVYSGATVLGDGSVALILDVQGIKKVVDVSSSKGKTHSVSDEDKDPRKYRDQQDYLLVALNSSTKHAIVLNYVHRLEEFKVEDIEISGHQRVVRYRGEVLPLVSCNKELGCQEKDWQAGEKFPVIVIERAGRLFGLMVNDILDTLVTDAEVQLPVEQETGIVGHLNLESELVVVIDPFEIISHCFPNIVMSRSNDFSKIAPVKAMDGGDGEESSPAYQAISRANILVAEDTPFFRKVIKANLEKAGHQVTMAEDGQIAHNILKNTGQPFDLIISDIEMPNLNGFDLARRVRKSSTHKHTPLLALSSRFDQRHKEEGREAGFDSYMEKFKPGELNQKILEMINGMEKSA